MPRGISEPIHELIRRGTVIPASPLALTADRRLDEQRQRALMRYYLDAGIGGIAVGMHFTQFEIRRPGIDMYEPVLRICAEEVDAYRHRQGRPAGRFEQGNGTGRLDRAGGTIAVGHLLPQGG